MESRVRGIWRVDLGSRDRGGHVGMLKFVFMSFSILSEK